jgi:hypothetical protein
MERLKEVIRTLIAQIREEERLREECLTGKVIRNPIPEVTDEDVERRIKEVLNDT